MSSGWIKLHRQITENVLWQDVEPFDKRSAWIDLLLMVNHEDREIIVNGKIMVVQRGQTLTSEVKLAERWRWSRNRVRRFIAAMEAAKMLTVKRTGYGTWLNVVNYVFFQGVRTGNGTGNDTADDTAHGTADDTAVGTQTRSNKNYKNFKNDKREGQAPRSFLPPSRQDIEAYCHEKNYCMDTQLFIDYYDARDWTLGKGQKMSNWKSAVNAWVRRERSSAPADGITDKQAKVSYERTMQRIEDMNKDAEASKGYDPSELLNKARLKLAGGEA